MIPKIFNNFIKQREELQHDILVYENHIDSLFDEALNILNQNFNKAQISIKNHDINKGELIVEVIDNHSNTITIDIDLVELEYTVTINNVSQEMVLKKLPTKFIVSITKAQNLLNFKYENFKSNNPDILEKHKVSKKRLNLIMKRKMATGKWFLKPFLILKDDIVRFLSNTDDETFEEILEDFQIISDKSKNEKINIILNSLTV